MYDNPAVLLMLGSMAAAFIKSFPPEFQSAATYRFGGLFAATSAVTFPLSIYCFIMAWGFWPGLGYMVAVGFGSSFLILGTGAMRYDGFVMLFGALSSLAGIVLFFS